MSCLELKKPIKDAISRIRFAPKSNNLLVSSWDSTLRLYDVDGSTLRVEAPSEAGLLDCCFQNELVAFSAGSDCCIRRYDLHSGIQDTIGRHGDLVFCVEYADITSQLITAGWDRKLIFWDTRSKNTVRCLDTPGAEVESMSIDGIHLMVAIGSSVEVYDLRDLNEPVYVKESCKGIQVRCVQPLLNCGGFVAGLVDGQVAVEYLNSTQGYVYWSHPKSKHGMHPLVAVNDIAFSPSVSGAFVTGNEEGYVTAWDAQSRKKLKQLSRYSNSVASLSFNCGGELLAVASSYSYQAANEIEEAPQIFIHRISESTMRSEKKKR